MSTPKQPDKRKGPPMQAMATEINLRMLKKATLEAIVKDLEEQIVYARAHGLKLAPLVDQIDLCMMAMLPNGK